MAAQDTTKVQRAERHLKKIKHLRALHSDHCTAEFDEDCPYDMVEWRASKRVDAERVRIDMPTRWEELFEKRTGIIQPALRA